LPAENAAIERQVHPGDWTMKNIAEMKKEFKTLGFAYDWKRELATCQPEYYRWEQMLFRKFYEQDLAYKKTGQLNWCENCQTVLANEQVNDGLCWRCDGPVTKKEQQQWYLRTTKYADQLLADHEKIRATWPERVLDMQKHWIGKSVGCEIDFALEKGSDLIKIFTTCPDTLFGVTFVTIAARHPLAETLCIGDEQKKELQRIAKEVDSQKREEEVTKDGFFTGSYCLHPFTGEKLPIWVGNFVVMDYGTGAVMAVPAHDQRDYEFAAKFGLPVKEVIQSDVGITEKAFTGEGKIINSGEFDGLDNVPGKTAIAKALEKIGKGKATTQYKLRDWGISRQRYWGTPIPVIYCDDCGTVLVPEEDLPVELPLDVKFVAGAGNPLASHESFIKVDCPQCKKPARRETDTMDTFVESSWYQAKFTSPGSKDIFNPQAVRDWMPVDCYIGGIEHACMHLLYARFFHKVLRDWGYVEGDEPFTLQLSQGMVCKDGSKMSKSKGNVVAPSAILEQYGADTARLFSLFAAPYEKDLDWNEKGVEGSSRFLARLWRLFFQFQGSIVSFEGDFGKGIAEPLMKIRRKTHSTIQKMTTDMESFKFNTAISAAMELVNEVYSLLATDPKAFDSDAGKKVISEALHNLVLCLSPFAPHFSEELWMEMGNKGFVADACWPKFDSSLLAEDVYMLVVQVNGKVRDKIEIAKSIEKEAVQEQVLSLPKLQPFLENKTVVKFIYVPGRIANVVVK